MTPRDYDDLLLHLQSPRRRVIADWPRFVRPLPPAPEPAPQWSGVDGVEQWLDESVGYLQRFVMACLAASFGLPAWQAFANREVESAAVKLAPEQALWQLARWVRGDAEQRVRVMREIGRTSELLSDGVRHAEDFEDPAAERVVSAIAGLAHVYNLCQSADDFPWCFGDDSAGFESIVDVLNDLRRDGDAAVDRWWRTVCTTFAFVDGLTAELE